MPSRRFLLRFSGFLEAPFFIAPQKFLFSFVEIDCKRIKIRNSPSGILSIGSLIRLLYRCPNIANRWGAWRSTRTLNRLTFSELIHDNFLFDFSSLVWEQRLLNVRWTVDQGPFRGPSCSWEV